MPARKLEITAELREKVKALSGCGLSLKEICWLIGVRSAKTLRKHFGDEIELGSIEALANVKRTQFRLASSGKHPWTTKRWLERHRLHAELRSREPVDAKFIVRVYQPPAADDDLRRKLLASHFTPAEQPPEWEGDRVQRDND